MTFWSSEVAAEWELFAYYFVHPVTVLAANVTAAGDPGLVWVQQADTQLKKELSVLCEVVNLQLTIYFQDFALILISGK